MRVVSSLFVIVLVLICNVTASASSDPTSNAAVTPVLSSQSQYNGEIHRVQPQHGELDEALVLIVKDIDNWWGPTANTDLLGTIPDVSWDIINSSQIATTNLDDYTFVLIEGNQDGTFNANVNAAMSYFEAYVDGGGWLQFHFATNTHDPRLTLWDGTTYIDQQYENTNWMGPDGEGHPALEGVSEPYNGNSANHGYFTVMPENALQIIVTSTQQPTYIEYDYGAGKVIGWTMPMEHGYTYNYNTADILYNSHVYCANRPPSGPVQIEIIPDNPPVIVPQGGSMGYSAHITSVYPPTVDAVAWITMEFPNGQIFGPLRQAPITISNGMDLWVNNLHQDIPLIAPLGGYKYHLSLGMNLGHPLLDDYFRFTVVAAGNQAGGATDWNLTGFDFGGGSAATDESEVSSLPEKFAMAEVYPNPFNPTANISIALPEATELNVTVFNVMGQQVATLAQGRFSTGTHQFVFDGSNLSSGIYFVHAATGNGESALQRIVLMK